MAELTAKVKVAFEMTETSKEVLRQEVRLLLAEAMSDSTHPLHQYLQLVIRDVVGDMLQWPSTVRALAETLARSRGQKEQATGDSKQGV